MTKLLRIVGKIEGKTLVAGAIWEQIDGKWRQNGMCAPSLYWMKGLSPEKTLACIKANGWTYEWIDDWPLFR